MNEWEFLPNFLKMKNKRMIRPDQVVEAAKRKEKENKRFRSFLKHRAGEQELDRQFLLLHKEVFRHYDCAKCRNCCKLLCAEIPEAELDRDAAFLNMSRESFISQYLDQGNWGAWEAKHLPCDFLTEGGNCKLGDCRPDSCKKFPYTDQPERLFSLYSVLNAVSVCPAAYEIFEALKVIYSFSSRGKRSSWETRSEEIDDGFIFVAGYTSGGAPYGVTIDEVQDDEADVTVSDDLPF